MTYVRVAAIIGAGAALYALVIRFALNWSRSRWDPDGDSVPVDEPPPTP